MAEESRKDDDRQKTSGWTGEPDPIAPAALAFVLAAGSIGFVIIGAIILG